ncbi:transcription termination factor NusA [Metamycoplasma equirhinis]|uniref:transcription termination factor NusA n=1 Tax=Metamycoplasma equirhinis TaxID=92402 RepID=UPI00359346FE
MNKPNNVPNQRSKEFLREIYNLANIKGIDESFVFELIKNAITKVIVEEYDNDAELEFILDRDNEIFKVFNHNKVVVKDPENDKEKDDLKRCIEIPLKIAKQINAKSKIDDTMSEEINFEEFGKRDYIRILSHFSQSLREKERSNIFNKYSSRIGQILSARINSKDRSGMHLELLEDATPAFMPSSNSNPRIVARLEPGAIIDVYIEEVKETGNTQVVVSSAEAKLLEKLFEREIPEIAAGYVEIVKIARIVGERAKVAIRKTEKAPEGIKELGAIFGNNSTRIEAISAQLHGEKIDAILYSDDTKEYIINAISPAKVIDVIEVSESNFPTYKVIVPTIHHTLAIGKKGQNVSLASDLVKAKLDIISQKEAIENNIDFNINNGNITLEEIQQLEQGKRLESNFKRKPAVPRQNFENTTFNISDFDDELAEMKQKAQQNDDIFEKQMFSESLDDQLKETLNKIEEEFANTSIFEKASEDIDPYSDSIEDMLKKEEVKKQDYEKITATKMKDFKKDDDLSAGLENIDLSDLDDENW